MIFIKVIFYLIIAVIALVVFSLVLAGAGVVHTYSVTLYEWMTIPFVKFWDFITRRSDREDDDDYDEDGKTVWDRRTIVYMCIVAACIIFSVIYTPILAKQVAHFEDIFVENGVIITNFYLLIALLGDGFELFHLTDMITAGFTFSLAVILFRQPTKINKLLKHFCDIVILYTTILLIEFIEPLIEYCAEKTHDLFVFFIEFFLEREGDVTFARVVQLIVGIVLFLIFAYVALMMFFGAIKEVAANLVIGILPFYIFMFVGMFGSLFDGFVISATAIGVFVFSFEIVRILVSDYALLELYSANDRYDYEDWFKKLWHFIVDKEQYDEAEYWDYHMLIEYD